MKFINKKTKILSYLPQILAMLFLAGFVAYAWTEPPSPPPDGNVDAPINVGSASQLKSGALGIDGVLRGYSDAIFDGNVGIGKSPTQKLDVQGDIMADSLINTGGVVLPSCGFSNRGQQFLRQGGIGSEDRFYICKKISNESYDWVALDSQSYVSAGTHNASLIVDDASVGTITWQNPQNAMTSNNVDAYAGNQTSGGKYSHYLKATGFNFTIPLNVQVYGIVINIEAAMNDDYGLGDASKINDVYLVINSPVGSPKSGSSYLLRGSGQYYTFGSVGDMWGYAWSPADINSPGFGVAVNASMPGAWDEQSINSWVHIDHIQVTVYYTFPGT